MLAAQPREGQATQIFCSTSYDSDATNHRLQNMRLTPHRMCVKQHTSGLACPQTVGTLTTIRVTKTCIPKAWGAPSKADKVRAVPMLLGLFTISAWLKAASKRLETPVAAPAKLRRRRGFWRT